MKTKYEIFLQSEMQEKQNFLKKRFSVSLEKDFIYLIKISLNISYKYISYKEISLIKRYHISSKACKDIYIYMYLQSQRESIYIERDTYFQRVREIIEVARVSKKGMRTGSSFHRPQLKQIIQQLWQLLKISIREIWKR